MLALFLMFMCSVRAVPSNPCPCDPMQSVSGRCDCYVCLDHKPWSAYKGKLSSANNPILREGGNRIPKNKLYAPSGYSAPDARTADFPSVDLYVWSERPDPQGPGYKPGVILFEGEAVYAFTDKKDINTQYVKKMNWISSFQRQKTLHKNNGNNNFNNPCGGYFSSKTYGVAWYQIDRPATLQAVQTFGNVQTRIRSNNAMEQYSNEIDYFGDNNDDELIDGGYLQMEIIGGLTVVMMCCGITVMCIIGGIMGYCVGKYTKSV